MTPQLEQIERGEETDVSSPRFAWSAWLPKSSDPIAVAIRTMIMPTPLLTVEGMVCHRGTLTVEQVLDHAFVGDGQRQLVAMIDLLAAIRVTHDADIVLVHLDGGSSCALKISQLVDSAVFLQLECAGLPDHDGAGWVSRLWSRRAGPSEPVVALDAMSFAAFVGRP
jgi:hypothetical protein